MELLSKGSVSGFKVQVATLDELGTSSKCSTKLVFDFVFLSENEEESLGAQKLNAKFSHRSQENIFSFAHSSLSNSITTTCKRLTSTFMLVIKVL